MSAAGDRVDAIVAAVSARRPEAVALAGEDGETMTYGALEGAVETATAALRSRGVRPGDRVALVFENAWTIPILLLAAMRCGSWAVPLNARLSDAEIDSIVAHADPRLAIFETAHSPAAFAHATRLGASIPADLPLPGLHAVERAPLLADADAAGSGGVAALIYTSGSTGRPKGVMLTHRNLAFIVNSGVATDWILPRDRVFLSLPMSHSYGLISVALSALSAGACLYPVARFAADRAAKAIRDGVVSAFFGVPTMYTRLLEYCRAQGIELRPNALRLAYIGGAPIDPAQKAAFEEALGLPLANGYGLTEAAPTICRTLAREARRDLSVGRPIAGIEVEMRDPETGAAVAGDGVGELVVRGPNIMLGYFRDPEATAAAIDADGWLRTGDLARRGADGRMFIAGRIKELIIRSGFNVYPQEVEQAICAHGAVEGAAVVGRAAEGNEEVVAYVQPRAGAALAQEDVAAWLSGKLAPYKQPSAIIVLDALPLTSTGKVNKMLLRQWSAANPSARSDGACS